MTRSRAYLGVGVAFPFAPRDGRLQLAVHEASIEQSIEGILLTDRRERVMLPQLGAGLRRLVFEPNTPATHRAVEEQVRTALVDWEPRIDVQEVRVGEGEAPNVLLVHLAYVVRATNTFYNRVYPFYLLEGHG
ncbi:MAG: GPW/gp25 family protein [Myxococcota bacterium]